MNHWNLAPQKCGAYFLSRMTQIARITTFTWDRSCSCDVQRPVHQVERSAKGLTGTLPLGLAALALYSPLPQRTLHDCQQTFWFNGLDNESAALYLRVLELRRRAGLACAHENDGNGGSQGVVA